MIPDTFLADLKQRTDLVSLGRDLGVEWGASTGSKEPKACCPFHGEKTPSFTVHHSKKHGHPIYHCYGSCARTWDAIEFWRAKTGDAFVPAVDALAARAGMRVPRQGETPEEQAAREAAAKRRAAVAKVLEAAQAFFAAALQEPGEEAGAARAYLESRGFPSSGGDPFGLGRAPKDGWRLLKHLEACGFGPGVQIAAGLRKPAEPPEGGQEGKRERPRFANRVTLPIRNQRGAVLSFAGRWIGELPTGSPIPKYLNGPETELFSKAETLYGLDLAAAEIHRRGHALVVEGHFDRLRCHLFDLPHAVALQGSAFTPAHAKALLALSPVVVFALDGDDAGDKALERALPVCLETGLIPRAVFLPRGEDPDSVLRAAAR